MADTRKITFSLDLTTDQAKHAVEEFQKQLGGLSQSMSSGLSDVNRFSASVSDSFTKSLSSIKGLLDKIQQEMKSGTLSELTGTKATSAITDLVGRMVDKSLKDTQTAVEVAAKKLTVAQEAVRKQVEAIGESGATEDNIKKLERLTANKAVRQQNYERRVEERDAAEKFKQTLDSGGVAALAAQQPPPFNAPPQGQTAGTGLGVTGGGAAGGSGGVGGLNTALLFNLLANGGSLTSLASPSGFLQAIGLLGGPQGRVAATVAATLDEVSVTRNRAPARNLEAIRQHETGNYTSIESGFLAREMIKDEGLGSYGKVRQGDLGFLGSLRFLGQYIKQYGNLEATRSALFEEELKNSESFGVNYQHAMDITKSRSERFYGIERMLGSDKTHSLLVGLNRQGISDQRAEAAVKASVEYGVPLDEESPKTGFLANFQNRYGVSDPALRELIRAESYTPGAMLNATKAYSYAGIGGAKGDQARGVLEDAAASYTQSFGGPLAEQARTPFFAATAAVGAAMPGLMERSPVEATKAAMSAASSRLSETGNIESNVSIVNRSALIDLGVTNPLAQLQILKVGVHTDIGKKMIAAVGGKSIKEIGERIYMGQKALYDTQERSLDDPQLRATRGVFSEAAGGAPISLTSMVRNMTDPTKAAADTAFNQAVFHDPKTADKMRSAPMAPGAEKPIRDTIAESNAKIAAGFVTITKALNEIKTGTLNVKIVEGAEKIISNTKDSEVKRNVNGTSLNSNIKRGRHGIPISPELIVGTEG